jgi:hypothetical protein
MGFQIPNFDEPGIGADDEEDDDTLEAELRKIQGDMGVHAPKRPKASQKKPGLCLFLFLRHSFKLHRLQAVQHRTCKRSIMM